VNAGGIKNGECANVAVRLPGVQPGDMVLLNAPADLPAGWAGTALAPSSPDQLVVRLCNANGGGRALPAGLWSYLVIR
jgi:hypothetical protein